MTPNVCKLQLVVERQRQLFQAARQCRQRRRYAVKPARRQLERGQSPQPLEAVRRQGRCAGTNEDWAGLQRLAAATRCET